MERLVVHDDSTLSASEFYEKYKEDDSYEELDIFKDLSTEEASPKEFTHKSGTGKPTYRPIAAVNDVITKPAKVHEELISCFRERLHVESTLKYTSVSDQRALAEVLIMAIVSKWPEHRKLAPHPFLTDTGNTELKRRVAVYIIHTVERLFHHYVSKAEEWNAMQIFSAAANLSRLKTQILQEADEGLNLPNIRRRTVEEMRLKPKRGWMVEENEELLLAALSVPKEKTLQQKHQELIERHLHELETMMPDLIESEQTNAYDLLLKHFHEAAENHGKKSSELSKRRQSAETGEEYVQRSLLVDGFSEHSNNESDANPQLPRCDSMPQLNDETELHEEFEAVQNLPKRRLSVNQDLVNGGIHRSNLKRKCLTNKEDLELLVSPATQEEKSVHLDDEFSPLLQVQNRRIPRKMLVPTEESLLDEYEEKESAKTEDYSDQPPILNVKVSKQNIVRICDARISNRRCESKPTLHKHLTIYNEFLNEIDEETVKTLDHHLHDGAEIREVYTEITKTMTKSYLEFDQDDYVQDDASAEKNTSQLFMSGLLHEKQYKMLLNDKLRVEQQAPWKDYSSADEWRNEPKFSGIGREDMLKINSKADMKSNRQSLFMADAAMTTNNQLVKSYSSWLTWYRNNINLDDYKKFLSTKDTDFLCESFHLYDSDDGDEDGAEAARTSAQLYLLKQREEQRRKLLAQKNVYQKGYWNAQCISLGGLGRDPSTSKLFDADSEQDKLVSDNRTNDESAIYLCLQDSLEEIWKCLKMPDQQRLNMAAKHSGVQSLERLAQVVECWGDVSEVIVQRENLIMKLEMFERTASDPNRFFQKGPNGSSVARMNESKVRGKLNKQIKHLDVEILRQLHFIKKTFGDDVTYEGRDYVSKMQSDRIEMLYWLQQERRKENLNNLTTVINKNLDESYDIPKLSRVEIAPATSCFTG